MAIAFVSALGSQSGVASTRSLSVALTTEDALVATTWTDNDTVDSPVITLDDGSGGSSQTFAQIGTQQLLDTGAGQAINMFILTAPTLTNTRILATFSGSTNHSLGAVGYSGVAQTNPITDVQQGVDATSTASRVNTSDRSGSWQIGTVSNESGSAAPNLDSGGSERQTYIGGSLIVDSNAGINSASTNTFVFSWSGGDSSGLINAMMRPPVTSNIKSIDGNAIANVKSVDTNVIANLKSLDTNP